MPAGHAKHVVNWNATLSLAFNIDSGVKDTAEEKSKDIYNNEKKNTESVETEKQLKEIGDFLLLMACSSSPTKMPASY